MMNERCEPFRDLLPCYALDALDPDEARAADAHVRSCVDCQAALKDYQAVSDGLMFAMPCQEPLLRARGFNGCVAVQASQDVAETRFLLDIAARHPFVRAVVGWVDLVSPDLERQLEMFVTGRYAAAHHHPMP